VVRLDSTLTVSYVEKDDRPGAVEEDEDGADDVDLLHFSGGVIDLGPAIRDEILLSMPLGPLCKEDCAGICALCGGNRNLSPCDCESRQRQSSSKFAVLAKVNLKQ
jgi:uncharacterized protein